jgi:magnesium-transporting ATPase (P-type)
MPDSLIAIRVLFILGIINLAAGILIFFSCRCLPGSRIGKRLMKYKWYQGFFKWHCYIWWIFWISVVIHAIFGLIYIGWPS